MNARPGLVTALIVGAVLLASPSRTLAQLPFDVAPEHLLQIDTAAIQWTGLSSYVGGVEATLRYRASAVTLDDCKAVAFLAILRLRNYYQRERGGALVSMRLGLECASLYRGSIDYDGVTVRLSLRERSSGDLVYQGRHHGLP